MGFTSFIWTLDPIECHFHLVAANNGEAEISPERKINWYLKVSFASAATPWRWHPIVPVKVIFKISLHFNREDHEIQFSEVSTLLA